MIDYKGLQALYSIIECQSFEQAAQALHISQPAVSQRLRTLQQQYDDPLLIRTLPYRATKLGASLLGHYKRVRLLEDSLSLKINQDTLVPKISIAISRDCLETWFIQLLETTNIFDDVQLDIIADDQEITLDYLRDGLVTACFSSSNRVVNNCQQHFLGTMKYIMVATPEFTRQYFNGKQIEDDLLNAPAIIFDNNDNLHDQYLRKYFNLEQSPSFHRIPSVRGFKACVLKGYAYALIPELDIVNELKSKKLINIFQNKVWEMPLYLHSWNLEVKEYQVFYKRLTQQVMQYLKCDIT